jgi:type 1 glutamine amidotransferase
VEDEQYVIEPLSELEVLISSVSPGLRTPCLWTKRYGSGRVVYCALGHDATQLRHPAVRTLVDNAVAWCAAASEGSS